MIKINHEKCIRCGLCVKDCPTVCLNIADDKLNFDENRCIECGHCTAVCPTTAIFFEDSEKGEIIESTITISPDSYLNFIKSKRSIRQFKEKKIEKEKIEKIIEAGRYTATARNLQDVRYIVLDKSKEDIRMMVLENLNEYGKEILKNENLKEYHRYAKMWQLMYKHNERDRIFFNSSHAILIVSKTPINGSIVSKNMDNMATLLGLGSFYSGFLVRASEYSDNIKKYLKLEEDENIIACLVLGYPNVKYFRTVHRKKANIDWK